MHIKILVFHLMFIVLLMLITVTSCKTQERDKYLLSNGTSSNIWVVSGKEIIAGEVIVDKEVLVLPGGSFSTNNSGKLVFNNKVTVLSQQTVFGEDLMIEFRRGSIHTLNVNWFGADGMDENDDTKSFQRIFSVITAGDAIQIDIPLGRYLISQQIIVEGDQSNHSTYILHGTSTSYSGTKGSTLFWTGLHSTSMFLLTNVSQCIFENIDFNADKERYLLSNIELRPYCNQITFKNCYFTGCAGENSCNINLNEGNNLQVSELFFENCIFKGILADNDYTENAVKGGLANTKNFHFVGCSFSAYRKEAINIKTSDVLTVKDCTFYLNDVDIFCQTCKTMATSNYSEESHAFFMSSASANFNATTLINNQFTGNPKDGFVIRDGSGTLILMNNNFGAGNYLEDRNFVRWEENEFNSIYSVGNVYKNASNQEVPFYNRQNKPYRIDRIFSHGDLGGVLGEGRIKLDDITH